MLRFATGALLLLLPWFDGSVNAEVSPNFKNCLTFFYKDTIVQGVTGGRYAEICQLFKNEYRFATLYDRDRRIPLYSAYILSPADGERPEEPWKIEPQLASSIATKDMEFQEKPDQNVKDSQAVDDDYKNSGYTRGHLTPSSHQKTEDDRRATFTLTNIVPQMKESNNVHWEKLEKEVLATSKKCKSKMYVITGAIPYESEEKKINNRVHVPEYLWSAYCCPSVEPGAGKNDFPTRAAVGRNDANSKDDIVKKENDGYNVKIMSLEELEKILKSRLKMPGISLFKDECKK